MKQIILIFLITLSSISFAQEYKIIFNKKKVQLPEKEQLFDFQTHTFTHCGQNGATGPTKQQCINEYNKDWVSQNTHYTVNDGIQVWTVPKTGTYRIEAGGASGGSGGRYGGGGGGAVMTGDFSLTKGQKLEILVGQRGTRSGYNYIPSGGGGTFVGFNEGDSIDDLLIVAGGGGGYGVGRSTYGSERANATIATAGKNGDGRSGDGGTNGNGGEGNGYAAAGGGGAISNGGPGRNSESGGHSFYRATERGYGGQSGDLPEGGFGGGGNTDYNTNWGATGGGGGFSGGGGASAYSSTGEAAGGGGGSYNTGSNKQEIVDGNSGHGYVTIDFIEQ